MISKFTKTKNKKQKKERTVPAIEIKLKRNEHIDKALKRLKRTMNEEGVLRELKDRQYFLKPGDKKRLKSMKARSRAKKEARERESMR